MLCHDTTQTRHSTRHNIIRVGAPNLFYFIFEILFTRVHPSALRPGYEDIKYSFMLTKATPRYGIVRSRHLVRMSWLFVTGDFLGWALALTSTPLLKQNANLQLKACDILENSFEFLYCAFPSFRPLKVDPWVGSPYPLHEAYSYIPIPIDPGSRIRNGDSRVVIPFDASIVSPTKT